MTDQPFTSYAFEIDKGTYPGIETPVPRTMPDRLNDVVNVKDWGALGNGSTDDTDAIQAAIRFACTLGQPGSNVCGAIVFFPPGVYIISKGGTVPLYVNQPGVNLAHVTMVGSGRDVTILRGDYNPGGQQEKANNGFIVQVEIGDLNYHGPLGGGAVNCGMQDLTIENTSTGNTSGACLNHGSGNNRFFDNCHFKGVTGFACTERSFGVSVRNCLFTCSRPITAASEPAATRSPFYDPSKFQTPIGGDIGGTGRITGGVGAYLAEGYFYNLHAIGFDIGFSVIGSATIMIGCSATQCGIGIATGIRNGSLSVVGLDSQSVAGNWYFLFAGQISSCKFDRCTWGIYAYQPQRTLFTANNVIGTTGPNIPAAISGMNWDSGTHVVTVTTLDDHNLSGTPTLKITPATWTLDTTDGFVAVTSIPTSKTFTYAGPLTTPPAFGSGSTWNYTLELGVFCLTPTSTLFAANTIDASVSMASFDAIAYGGDATRHDTSIWATKGKYGWILPYQDPDGGFPASVSHFEMCGGGGSSSLVRPNNAAGNPVRFPGIPNTKYFPGYQDNAPGFSTEGSELNFISGAPGLTFDDPLYVFLSLALAAVPTDGSLTFASVPSSVIAGMDVRMWGSPNVQLGTVQSVLPNPPFGTAVLIGPVGRSLPVGTRINFLNSGSTHYKTRYDGTTWRVVG